MIFPGFQPLLLGKGMVIGLNATVHVFLSHGFPIGAFAMIALAELIGHRRHGLEPNPWEDFARYAIKPVTIIITSVSAVTGVGIWFTIGPLAPRATSSMLRVFFWPWYIEWVVFVSEAVVLLLYYFLWDRMKETPALKRGHLALGIAYTGLALASAILITGIIGFMLTPDGFPRRHDYLRAYFNPSLWPQTFARFFAGLSLGSMLVVIWLWIHRESDPPFKRRALRLYGACLLGFMALTALFEWLYFRVVPSTYKTHALFAVLTSHLSQDPRAFWVANAVALFVLLVFAAVALAGLRRPACVLLVPALVAGLGFVAEFERIREFIRGPFLMPGYMYASEVLLKEVPWLDETGSLARTYWYNALPEGGPAAGAAGRTLFVNNCSNCHTVGGINDIRERVRGRPQEAIALILANTNRMVPFMPPFAGTAAERGLLARWIYLEAARGGAR